MIAEIASKWVTDGTAMELVNWQREALRGRHEIVAEMLDGLRLSLRIRKACMSGCRCRRAAREEGFVAQARLRAWRSRPALPSGRRMRRGSPAVRISLGSTTEAELRTGLGIVARLLLGDPEHLLLAI